MLNKLRLLTPGPTPMPENVRLAMAQDMIHHRKSQFTALMQKTQTMLRELFGTAQPVLPLASSGSGAMTAAVGNLFSPGEKLVVARCGTFGDRWKEIAEARGLVVRDLAYAGGQAIDPAQVEAALDAEPDIAGLLVQVSETSTGVLNPVRELGAICRKRQCLLVADGISAVGISPCPMDEWGVDCLLTGSQKGLMLPPGLALLAMSARAWQKAASVVPACYYFDLKREREKLEQGQTRFTTPVSLIYGLEASMAGLLADGLDAIYRKQWALTMLARSGVQAMGLEPLARENFTWGLTSIRLPQGIDGVALLKLAEQRWGVCMAGGQGALKGRIVRLGHMGHVDWGDVLAGLYALEATLQEMGSAPQGRDWTAAAMQAYSQALGQLSPGPGSAQAAY